MTELDLYTDKIDLLVFADWLDEHHLPNRATAIRLAVEQEQTWKDWVHHRNRRSTEPCDNMRVGQAGDHYIYQTEKGVKKDFWLVGAYKRLVGGGIVVIDEKGSLRMLESGVCYWRNKVRIPSYVNETKKKETFAPSAISLPKSYYQRML